MHIDYFWIDKFGPIEQQGFNCNPNIRFDYDPATYILHRKVDNKVPSDFFATSADKIIVTNITALLGANGTGKSFFLKALSAFLVHQLPMRAILVSGDKVYYRNHKQKVKLGKGWDKSAETIYNVGPIIGDDVRDTILVNYAGELNLDLTTQMYQTTVSLEEEYENSFFADISDITMVGKDQNRYSSGTAYFSGENPLIAFRSGEAKRFIDFINMDVGGILPFGNENFTTRFYLNSFTQSFFDSYDAMAFRPLLGVLSIMPEFTGNETFTELSKFGIIAFFEAKLEDYKKQYRKNFTEMIFYHALLVRHMRQQLMERMGEMSIVQKLPEFLGYLRGVLKSFSRNTNYLSQIKHYLRNSSFAFYDVGQLKTVEVDRFIRTVKAEKYWNDEQLDLRFTDLGELNHFVRALARLSREAGVKYDTNTIFDIQLLGLSTGERQFLKLFSRLLSIENSNTFNHGGIYSIIMLIDEFEIGFHPLWQRQFIKKLISYLESYYSQFGNRVQVQLIITSHSPFVASDLPKECICFLSRQKNKGSIVSDSLNNHEKTFGANIHSLLSDSFFLDRAHIGDWAEYKIKKVFGELMSDNEIDNDQVYRPIINMVGEPLIRMKLEELVAHKMRANPELQILHAQRDLINKRIEEISKKNDTN